MSETARQLVLDLPVETSHAAVDFLVGPANRAAHDYLARWPDWPVGIALLEGPRGSGKSHLAAIWAGRAAARRLPADAVTDDELPGLTGDRALVVEDIDRHRPSEAALFHLVNATREAGGSLLLTSTVPPDRLGLATPDLLSRLRLAPSLRLGAPDDALLRAVVVKLFADRQVAVDPAVVDYLVARMERSFARAGEIVAALDAEALRRRRAVTRPIAAELFKDLGLEDDGAD